MKPDRLADLPWAILRVGRAGGGRARGVLRVWTGWERLWLWRHPTVPARPGGLFRYRIATYRGRERRLEDGTEVHRGDRVVELHFDNREFAAWREAGRYSTWKAVHELRQDLTAIGSRAASGELGPVKALYGVSLLGDAAAIVGLETIELPHDVSHAFQRYFMAGLDAVYHPAGVGRLVAGRVRTRWPSEVWMSISRATELSSRP